MAITKLTASSRAFMLLRKKVPNGDISAMDNANAVWESELIFYKT